MSKTPGTLLPPCKTMPMHPHSGLTALWVSPSGRAFYPIAGGDGSGDPTDGTTLERRIDELATRGTALQTEIAELDALDEPTEEQSARFDAALTEFDEVTEEHTRLSERHAQVARVRSAAFARANREPAGGGGGDSGPRDRSRTTRAQERAARNKPFEDTERLRHADPEEVRARALDAVELSVRMDDDTKEVVTNLLEGRGADRNHVVGRKQGVAIARHVLLTGSDDYHEAFERYMENPESNARAAMALANANGGFLVPFTLDPTVILTNAGSANPFRRLANVKTTATSTWNGVTSAGVNAEWLAEAAEASDASPTFGSLQIKPEKAAAWLFGSYEVLEDSDISSDVPRLLADAKDRIEADAFAVGNGAGKPFGVVPRATAVMSGTAATLAASDVYNVQGALPARFRGPQARVAWLANLAIINRIRQFDTAGGSSFWANLGMDRPERLLGAPIEEATSMVGTITTGSKNLLVGDFSQYFIVDRIGMSVLYEPLVKGANQRPTGQAGWFAFWRTGGDVATSQAFRVLQES